MNTKKKTTRKEAREDLSQLHLSCELVIIIRYFPTAPVGNGQYPKKQSYITYAGWILLVVRILISIFYISNTKKTSEKSNFGTMAENQKISLFQSYVVLFMLFDC